MIIKLNVKNAKMDMIFIKIIVLKVVHKTVQNAKLLI